MYSQDNPGPRLRDCIVILDDLTYLSKDCSGKHLAPKGWSSAPALSKNH